MQMIRAVVGAVAVNGHFAVMAIPWNCWLLKCVVGVAGAVLWRRFFLFCFLYFVFSLVFSGCCFGFGFRDISLSVLKLRFDGLLVFSHDSVDFVVGDF